MMSGSRMEDSPALQRKAFRQPMRAWRVGQVAAGRAEVPAKRSGTGWIAALTRSKHRHRLPLSNSTTGSRRMVGEITGRAPSEHSPDAAGRLAARRLSSPRREASAPSSELSCGSRWQRQQSQRSRCHNKCSQVEALWRGIQFALQCRESSSAGIAQCRRGDRMRRATYAAAEVRCRRRSSSAASLFMATL